MSELKTSCHSVHKSKAPELMCFYIITSAALTLSSGVFARSCCSYLMGKQKSNGGSQSTVETCNIAEDTIIAQRLVCDHVRVYGSVSKVPLTKEMLNYCATARNSRNSAYLEEEKSKKERAEQNLKRKNAEESLEELKRRRKSMCESLQKDADNFAEQAENTAGTKMATLITKSNTLRRPAKEKRELLLILTSEIDKKTAELRHMGDIDKHSQSTV